MSNREMFIAAVICGIILLVGVLILVVKYNHPLPSWADEVGRFGIGATPPEPKPLTMEQAFSVDVLAYEVIFPTPAGDGVVGRLIVTSSTISFRGNADAVARQMFETLSAYYEAEFGRYASETF